LSERKPASRKPGAVAARGGAPASGDAASRLIDGRIRDLADWRGETLAAMRALILSAEPDITEEWKWRGTPVWSHHGIVCTGETYAKVVKLTFARGASLPDPARLFNASLEGGTRRAIDIREGETIDAAAFKALVRAAVAENEARTTARAAAKAKRAPRGAKQAAAPKGGKAEVVLLSGGNPQIRKGDGDAPVQAYIAAMPGWKREVGERLDALVTRTVPNVRKAVKWNSPFYGVEGQGWFLAFHVFTRYVKVTFFKGASLKPLPPGPSKHPETRYLDIHEEDGVDAAQLANWVKQAAALPGWMS
jgi:hypothetical protein